MLKQIQALMLCAMLAMLSTLAADSKPEPKPIPADLALDISKAQAKLQAVEREKEATLAALKERILTSDEFRRLDDASRKAQGELNNLTGKARAATGAPVACFPDLDLKWVQQNGQSVAPCVIEPKTEAKKAEVKK